MDLLWKMLSALSAVLFGLSLWSLLSNTLGSFFVQEMIKEKVVIRPAYSNRRRHLRVVYAPKSILKFGQTLAWTHSSASRFTYAYGLRNIGFNLRSQWSTRQRSLDPRAQSFETRIISLDSVRSELCHGRWIADPCRLCNQRCCWYLQSHQISFADSRNRDSGSGSEWFHCSHLNSDHRCPCTCFTWLLAESSS
jgi:hypothetical protein